VRETVGDEAAAERAGRLGTLTQELAHASGGRVIKLLGDGAMLLFPVAAEAVRCMLGMVEQLEQAGLPPARAGIASGPVVLRDGDCYGRVVNVAARVTDRALPHQVLVTQEVVRATPANHARFEPIGAVALKGIGVPLELSVASLPA
jgi:adenylate cyclase